jgi:hypothetical protein
MAKTRVCVTKITLEYVAGGKVFAVDLDPMEVSAIFFDDPAMPGPGRLDMEAAQAAQNERAKAGQPDARPVRATFFQPDRPLQDQQLGNLGGARSRQVGTVTTDPGGPSLWWHTLFCAWFHPKG